MVFRARTFRRGFPLLFCTGVLSLGTARGQSQPSPNPTTTDLAVKVEQVAEQLRNTEGHLQVVETQYAHLAELSDEELLAQNFSQGEIQYLLGEYSNAAVLFYDLVSKPGYPSHPRYPDALFYLAESLYHLKNLMGAKFYLKQLLQAPNTHQEEALVRFVEISIRLNEFVGVEEQVLALQKAQGPLPPALAYVFGKWMFQRRDLSLEERIEKAAAIFAPLALREVGPYRLQAGYFLGVGLLKQNRLEEALTQFARVVEAKPDSAKDKQVQELASLSMGRVLYELGRYDEAIDRYQDIPRDSDNFIHAMYEVAWAHVRKNQFQQALNAAEVLLLVARNSTLEPEVMLLRAHLLSKLGRYTEASDTYHAVIDTFEPIRDEIESLLKIHADPVRYFDQLLAKSDRQLEVSELLPPLALKWATTQEEVQGAVQMMSDLDFGKREIASSEDIAQRLFNLLDERGMETFPELQEGYTRASAVESALVRIEQSLLSIDQALAENLFVGAEVEQWEQLKAQRKALQARFDTLPSTAGEVSERRNRMQSRVMELDREAFKLGYELQSMFAVVSAVEKWLDDTRPEKTRTLEDEKLFVEKLNMEIAELTALQKKVAGVRQQLIEERASADAVLTGEESLRQAFADILKQQRQLIQSVQSRLPTEALMLRNKTEDCRMQVAKLQARVLAAKQKLRDRLAVRVEHMKDIVRAEQALIQTYSKEAQAVSRDARNMVGNIVVDSFGRVRRQFYDLVLKADVGVVDVAFTRKQDKTTEIQKLSHQKDTELQTMDSEFKEVLEDVDR